jgi:hypothetical protein
MLLSFSRSRRAESNVLIATAILPQRFAELHAPAKGSSKQTPQPFSARGLCRRHCRLAGRLRRVARPKDLITVNLGDFKPDLKGETRAEIDKGALRKQPKVVWVDNAIDAQLNSLAAFLLKLNADNATALQNAPDTLPIPTSSRRVRSCPLSGSRKRTCKT